MKIIHISYDRIHEQDPERWLNRIHFFCGILEAMTSHFSSVISIHCIEHDGNMTRNNIHYRFFRLTQFDGMFPSRLHSFVKASAADVVIVHGMHFPLQVIQLRRTVGASVKIFIQNHAEKPLRFHKHFLQRSADKKIHGYFFAASGLGEAWVKRKQVMSMAKIHEVMEVSSPFYVLPPESVKNRLSLKEGKKYLWVGRLDHNKDPLTLMRAFAKFLDSGSAATLYVVFQQNEILGDVQQLLESYPDKKDKIVLVGKVDHGELLYWYNSVDFIISTSHYEGSGLAVCEAMSCGCIPILTNIPSFRMMTDNGACGFIFEPRDSDQLAHALQASSSISIPAYRDKVLQTFKKNLSYEAIAEKFYRVVSA